METHLRNINSLIDFLEIYKNAIRESSTRDSAELDILLDYSDMALSNYNDTLYDILNYKNNLDLSGKIKEIVYENKQINENIKEVIPFILYYFACKGT